MVTIDHFMYAVPTLEAGIRWAAARFDAEPAYGGVHVGLGTRNALLSLGDCYLEIIAPDPQQQLAGNLGEQFAKLSDGGLVTWAARGELPKIARTLAAQGVETTGPVRTERRTAQGDLLAWELLFPKANSFGARMPFFIDWLKCPHPSATNPRGGRFAGLTITTPDAGTLDRMLTSLGIDVGVSEGAPGLCSQIDTAKGRVTLEDTAETRALMLGR